MMTRVCASSAPNGSSSSSTFGSRRERADDADALLHAARELSRVMLLERGEAGETEQRARGALALAERGMPLHLQAELDVLAHRLPGKQRILLKHHAAVGAGAVHRLAVDGDDARGRLEEAGDRVEQRRLSAAGGTDDRDELAGLDVNLRIGDGFDRPLELS